MDDQDILKWDLRFLRLAREVSTWSKDPGTKVGAYIAKDQRPLGFGYNGFPRGVPDDPVLLFDREKKLLLTIHAEGNAILNSTGDTSGATVYVYPFMPCSNCAGLLRQAGIVRVVSIKNDAPRWQESFRLSRFIFDHTGILLDLYPPEILEGE